MKTLIRTMFIAAMGFALLLPKDNFAQGRTTTGVKVGLNIANIGGEDADPGGSVEKKSKLGVAVGLCNVVGINDMLGIRAELLYSMKGFIYEGEVLGRTYTTTGTLKYLEVPLLIQYAPPVEGWFQPNVFIGPVLSIHLSARTKAEYNGEEEEADIEHVKSVDVGFVFGAGAVVQETLTCDVRYNTGLTSFNETPENEGGPFDVKNQVISILLGYAF